MSSRSSSRILLSAALALCLLAVCEGHGYLSEPVARNLYANRNGMWWCPGGGCVKPESCPHCISSHTPSDVCGGGYTYPTDTSGNRIDFPIQGRYTAGDMIRVSSTMTAYHGGHIEFYLCDNPDAVTHECFRETPLYFDPSVPYYDADYPERLYTDPYYYGPGISEMGLRLPSDVTCDRCVLAWEYHTANSCLPNGYRKWVDQADPRVQFNTVVGDCGDYGPFDSVLPERFWNCADIAISAGDGSGTPPGSPSPGPTPSPNPTTGPSPTQSPTPPTSPSTPTPAPTTAPPGKVTACDANGNWPSCPDAQRGPCMNASGQCYPLFTDGTCHRDLSPYNCKDFESEDDLPKATPAPTPSGRDPTPAPTSEPGMCRRLKEVVDAFCS